MNERVPGIKYPEWRYAIEPQLREVIRNIYDNLSYDRGSIKNIIAQIGTPQQMAENLLQQTLEAVASSGGGGGGGGGGTGAIVRVSTHAIRVTTYGTATDPVGTLFLETDRTAIYYISNASGINHWQFAAGNMVGPKGDMPTGLGVEDIGFIYTATEDHLHTQYSWSGTGWITVGGLIGPPGRDGIDGEDGQVGPPGRDGTIGVNGAAGLPGPPGLDGYDGDDGLPGPAGSPGAAGGTGPAGTPGAPGVDGLDGQDGQDGIPGTQGPQGIQGVTGAQGVSGFPGMDGQDGDEGAPGIPGTMGVQGIQGATGIPGPPGADGLDGADGQDGLLGLQGATGATGVVWKLVINEDGSSLTNWTQVSGVWSVVSSAFHISTGATTVRNLRWTPRIAQSVLVFEADVNLNSGGGFAADNRVGFTVNHSSIVSGGSLIVLRSTGALTPSTTGVIMTEQPGGVTAGPTGLTNLFNLDQYYKLRVVAVGPVMDIYVDGVFKYSLLHKIDPAAPAIEYGYVSLYAYNCNADFKNIKMYTTVVPGDAGAVAGTDYTGPQGAQGMPGMDGQDGDEVPHYATVGSVTGDVAGVLPNLVLTQRYARIFMMMGG